MKRKVIKIDESKCNGCGLCIPNCPEGAIQIIDNKARLVSDLFCDGLGACIGNCPQGAISIEEREALKYDERKVMENIITQGDNVIKAHLRHLKEHGQNEYLKIALDFLKMKGKRIDRSEINKKCGCPGSMMISLKKTVQESSKRQMSSKSQLRQWPIQLHLLNANAPYFKNADIVIAADCFAYAYPSFHQRFLNGKILIIFCPKLDNAGDIYVEKLVEIFKNNNIRSITLLHMEVPCCFGLVRIAEGAVKASNKSIIVKDYTISIRGEII